MRIAHRGQTARRRRRFRGHRFTYPVPRRLRKSAAVTVYAQLAPVGARSERPGASPETGAGDLRNFEQCTVRP